MAGPVVVAVDGRSAGGKSTVAARIVEAIPGTGLVHTDDVAWWHSFFDWTELMRSGVLQPLTEGAAVHYTPPAWTDRGRPGAIEVPAGAPMVVIEGVGAARRELSDLVDVVVWVQADEEVRLAREAVRIERGEVTAELVEEWQRDELAFLADQRPWERARHVIVGTPDAVPGDLGGGPHDVLVGPSLSQA